uniref:EDRF1 TPR repeats region domain-containing protein n=1 Tax=Pseudo-nitzschia australis TaxID=44445 RepID=A0A7S4EJR0_9STRA
MPQSSEYLPRAIASPSDPNNVNNHHERQHQPYASVSIDKLNKARDHLVRGISTLSTLFEKDLEKRRLYREAEKRKQDAVLKTSRRRQRQQQTNVYEAKPKGSDEEEKGNERIPMVSPAMVMQLFGMNFKLVNVSLRLAEHHLGNYYSSSAMQALRTAARRLNDAAYLLDLYKIETREIETEANTSGIGKDKEEDEKRRESLQLQYIWLLEHCGHFARSFASDELWRDRGHASGEDVISVLSDVENAFVENSGKIGVNYGGKENKNYKSRFWRMVQLDVLLKTSKGRISLHSLSGIVAPPNMDAKRAEDAIDVAEGVLNQERTLRRERRKVLVASCVSYSRAITAFQYTMMGLDPSEYEPAYDQMVLLNLLRQRLGDACNETGKVLLAALRTLLVNNQGSKKNDGSQLAAEAILCSAEFWFTQGLEAFQACGDTRNLALLRCNLCQSYKLRANSGFSKGDASSSSKHAEDCLQHAADQLLTAHEDLGQRDVDPQTWDMVSEELAATFLVLGVRRRQSLLGSGNAPVIFQVMRLSPGQERSVVEPMERALKVYKQSDNAHQAAAVHYQLALTYSKLWTCQLNESNTRKKLSKAFENYSSAFTYFSNHTRGNEPSFCLLCLDLASLYAAIPGEEGIIKSLGCCLDCCDTFSMESIKASTALAASTAKSKADWYDKMETIAESVDDRVFKLLRSLVKIDPVRYKDLYREGLTAKMVSSVPDDDDFDMNAKSAALLALHDVLLAIKKMYGIIVCK